MHEPARFASARVARSVLEQAGAGGDVMHQITDELADALLDAGATSEQMDRIEVVQHYEEAGLDVVTVDGSGACCGPDGLGRAHAGGVGGGHREGVEAGGAVSESEGEKRWAERTCEDCGHQNKFHHGGICGQPGCTAWASFPEHECPSHVRMREQVRAAKAERMRGNTQARGAAKRQRGLDPEGPQEEWTRAERKRHRDRERARQRRAEQGGVSGDRERRLAALEAVQRFVEAGPPVPVRSGGGG